MLARELIRPGRVYWVKHRKKDTAPTLAVMTGELPDLSMRCLDEPTYSIYMPSDYDFLGEAKMDELFAATFKGLTLDDLTTPDKVVFDLPDPFEGSHGNEILRPHYD